MLPGGWQQLVVPTLLGQRWMRLAHLKAVLALRVETITATQRERVGLLR